MIRTPEFEAFVAPATHYPAIWRILLGLFIGGFVFFAGSLLVAVVVNALIAVRFSGAIEGYQERSTLEVIGDLGATPDSMIVLLATFIAMGLGAVVAAAFHRRGLASLIGPFRPACRNFSRSVLLCAAVFFAVGTVMAWVLGHRPIAQMDLATWALFLPVAIPLLLIQTGAEELVFRGYLMQALAARFRSALIWMGLPTVLFGLAHWTPEVDPTLAVIIVCATGLFGLAAADLTRVTGNLGAAIGFHFANNFFALFLVAIAGEMSGLSLYLTPFTMDDVSTLLPLLVLDMITVVLVWWLLRSWLRPAEAA